MGEIMTLRGALPFEFGAASGFGTGDEHLIFSYESPDRKKAWKVRFARMWIQECIIRLGPIREPWHNSHSLLIHWTSETLL